MLVPVTSCQKKLKTRCSARHCVNSTCGCMGMHVLEWIREFFPLIIKSGDTAVMCAPFRVRTLAVDAEGFTGTGTTRGRNAPWPGR